MKTILTRAGLAVALTLLSAVRMTAAESLSTLLQRGIYAEETEGNLDSAIKIYEQIAAEAAANRDLVAQAQYRLAVCYQKKGNKPAATKLLHDLIQQGGAGAHVQKAQAVLRELSVTVPNGPVVRKLPLAFSTDWIMSISADGRFLAYEAPAENEPRENGHIALCDLQTGKSWNLAAFTKDYSPWYDAQVSPDGQWIAYQLSRSKGADLFVSKIDGSDVRKLVVTDDTEFGMGLDGWSTDSRRVLVETWSEKPDAPRGYDIIGFDARTGTRAELARIIRGEYGQHDRYEILNQSVLEWVPLISPDGHYFARRHGSFPRTISLRNLKTGGEETVVPQDAGRVFGWLNGGRQLLYSQTRLGANDLYAVEIANGKPSAAPELVWTTMGNIYPLRIATDGRMYFVKDGGGAAPDELLVMEGLSSLKAMTESWRLTTDIAPEEILEAGDVVHDHRYKFSFQLPSAWKVTSAVRRDSDGRGTMITFRAPGLQNHVARVTYRSTTPWTFPSGTSFAPAMDGVGPKPTNAVESDRWLRRVLDRTGRNRSAAGNYQNFRLRAGSLSSHSFNGSPGITYWTDFVQNDRDWVERCALILMPEAVLHFTLRVPAADIEKVRRDWERMIESLQSR